MPVLHRHRLPLAVLLVCLGSMFSVCLVDKQIFLGSHECPLLSLITKERPCKTIPCSNKHLNVRSFVCFCSCSYVYGLVLTLKALKDMGPGYLKDHLYPYSLPCKHDPLLKLSAFAGSAFRSVTRNRAF